MENVIAVTFDDDSKAYTALTSLGQLGQQHRVELGGASVVVRAEDGHVETKEEIVDSEYEGMAVGGFMGLLLGVTGAVGRDEPPAALQADARAGAAG